MPVYYDLGQVVFWLVESAVSCFAGKFVKVLGGTCNNRHVLSKTYQILAAS